MLEPQAIRREVLHQTVQDRIKRFIIEGGYQPGTPLPAEADLARALGVSRPSLREAMRALQTLGVVEVRHGAGTYVGRFSLDQLVGGLTFRILMDHPQTVQTLRDLLDIRMILERSLIERVAAERTGEQIAELDALVAQMERRAASGEIFPDEDRAFHQALYRHLGNAMVVDLLQAFWDTVAAVRTELGLEFVSPQTTAADHRHILSAIEAGDASGAAAAMTDHFKGIQERLLAPLTGRPEDG